MLLAEVPDHFKTEEMYEKVVEDSPWYLIDVPEHLKTEEICNKAVDKSPLLLVEVPDHFKTQEMCNKAVKKKIMFIGPRPFKECVMRQCVTGHGYHLYLIILGRNRCAIK